MSRLEHEFLREIDLTELNQLIDKFTKIKARKMLSVPSSTGV